MGPLSSGEVVIITKPGPYFGLRGWVLGWRGQNPLIKLEDETVELAPSEVRAVVTRRKS